MKKVVLLIYVSFLVFGLLSAKKFPGEVVYFSGVRDVVTVDVPMDLTQKYISFYMMNKKMKCKNLFGKKLKVKPDLIKEVQFEIDGMLVRMISQEMKPGKGRFFLLLYESEHMSVYRYFEATGGGGVSVYDYLKKGNEPLRHFSFYGFKAKCSDYFADCPALQQKIKDGDYKSTELADIVEYYVEKCK